MVRGEGERGRRGREGGRREGGRKEEKERERERERVCTSEYSLAYTFKGTVKSSTVPHL